MSGGGGESGRCSNRITIQATDFGGGILPAAQGLTAGGVRMQAPPCLPLPALIQSSPEIQEMPWMK